ncbi:O-acyltransferase WSD1-like [Coffea eugenioides]|uniref:O-acyltransferase WSD1-like n=1 Tax=Coffea eugenioides TaxID=49369 RepID=UPI000F610C6D|nr:O-acyltransferase WSD1-like [Coffea eugenioides]XP_027172137.1 O-acyltransferase WSD1-like [Coffea eugenioides]
MEFEHEEELLEPVSPTGQYMRSSALSLSIIGVMELEIPMAESIAIQLVKDLFLPINPRFSSIMKLIAGEDGQKKWKRVEVNINEHVNFPKFPQGMSPDYYDDCLSNYLSKLGMEDFPPERPLWEIHVMNYPTTNAASNIVFKLHHALGDGYSFVGALLSCLKRSDNPSLPLTFPSLQSKTKFNTASTTFLPDVLSRAFNTIYYFGYGVLKGFLLRDDHSSIRSDDEGVLFRPLTMTTMEFSLDQFKQIKAKLRVVNLGVIY